MNAPLITDAEHKVKDALAVWVEWMKSNQTERLGYGKCAGFSHVSGGSLSWDEFEQSVNKTMAISVQAIY